MVSSAHGSNAVLHLEYSNIIYLEGINTSILLNFDNKKNMEHWKTILEKVPLSFLKLCLPYRFFLHGYHLQYKVGKFPM